MNAAYGCSLKISRHKACWNCCASRVPSLRNFLHPWIDDFFFAVVRNDHAGIALLAAQLATADGRHEEALIVGVELDLEFTHQAEGFGEMRTPPSAHTLAG